MSEEKTTCQSPHPDKQPTNIPTWKYQAVHDAILAVAPKKDPGIAAMDLPGAVKQQLPAKILRKLGSVSWHTTTVKLHMEVTGELRRVPELKPHRLVGTGKPPKQV
ncbi:MAG: hypothetical protein AB8B93_00125 [Pseudomonadales bacterium]